jgi:hypothetical protein
VQQAQHLQEIGGSVLRRNICGSWKFGSSQLYSYRLPPTSRSCGTLPPICKMTIEIEKYLIPTDKLDFSRILSTWTWLTGDKSIVALTKSGDALLKDNNGNLYFLDVGGGTIELKSNNYSDFFDNKLSYELTEELLLPAVVDKLEQHGITLREGQVYTYSLLPIIGGTYDEKNMFALDLYDHYNLTGDIHFQIKDTPDGTKVEIKVE